MKKRPIIIKVLAAMLFVSACDGSFDTPRQNEVRVGFSLAQSSSNGPSTKTFLDPEIDKVFWQEGDKLAVWAQSGDGSTVLSAQTFSLLASRKDASSGYFSSIISAPMPQGTYTYYMTYPLPLSVSGTSAKFTIPAVQDGKASGGVDITIADPISFQELSQFDETLPTGPDEGMRARLRHLLHFLRFYIPEGRNLLGEPVEKIEFGMPEAIAGTITADIVSRDATLATDGSSKKLTLVLGTPMLESAGSDFNYAVAGIFPPQQAYADSALMQVTLFSRNKIGHVDPIRLSGRSFGGGHITSVPLKPTSIQDYFTIVICLGENHLGQEVRSVTLTIADGTPWPDTASNVYSYTAPDGTFAVGDEFRISTGDEAAFRALSGKSVVASFESDDAIVSQSLTLGNLTSGTSSLLTVRCPYLLEENFEGTSTDFNINGNLSATGHSTLTIEGSNYGLPSWTGNQIAVIEAGGNKALAIRHQNETYWLQGTYRGRADSAPLSGIKSGSSVKVKVEFNYSGYSPKNVPQMSYGWGTKQGEIAGYYQGGSAAVSGGEHIENVAGSLITCPSNGSASNVNKQASFEISGAGSTHRLTWDCYGPKKSSTTCQEWVLIDNIKVIIIE